jgi:hypothetical protein
VSEIERLHDAPLPPIGPIADKPGSGRRQGGKPPAHDPPGHDGPGYDGPGAGPSDQPKHPDAAGAPSEHHRNPDFLIDEYA